MYMYMPILRSIQCEIDNFGPPTLESNADLAFFTAGSAEILFKRQVPPSASSVSTKTIPI